MSAENKDQKKIWKKEAAQQRKDLSNRPKEVWRRPVEIKFGGTHKPKRNPEPSTQRPRPKDHLSDAFLRRQLGLK